jgi:hypothetical protein
MTFRKMAATAGLILVALVVGAAIAVYAIRVPQVERNPASFWKQQGFKEVTITSNLSWLIRRAQLDFMLFPTEVGPRKLVLQSLSQSPEIMYAVFRPRGSSHTAIVYAYLLPQQKALWKAQIAMD